MGCTPKQTVRGVYPKARAKRYWTGRGSYVLIWSDYLESERLAEGKTMADAWKAAAKKCESKNL